MSHRFIASVNTLIADFDIADVPDILIGRRVEPLDMPAAADLTVDTERGCHVLAARGSLKLLAALAENGPMRFIRPAEPAMWALALRLRSAQGVRLGRCAAGRGTHVTGDRSRPPEPSSSPRALPRHALTAPRAGVR